MAATYATADANTYCDHPSHDGPPWPTYSEYWDADICGNCGIPVAQHGGEYGEWVACGTDPSANPFKSCPSGQVRQYRPSQGSLSKPYVCVQL